MRTRYNYILLLLILPMFATGQKMGPSVKKILFLGNSITWAGNYITDIETYLTIHYPNRQFEIINAGVPSETVSGLSEAGHADGQFPRPDLEERINRVLSLIKPDLVFAGYGMNDGIYLPLDQTRFQKFKDGILRMHDKIIATGARLIHLTPEFFDELRGGHAGYEKVMTAYTDWLLSLRNIKKWEVVDVYHPMQKYLDAHRKVDAQMKIDGFELAGDGVHPGETGHWIMAKQVLLYLGCPAGNITSFTAYVKKDSINTRIYQLIGQRQQLLRDAWLSFTKHKRPGLPAGKPIDEATMAAKNIQQEIFTLLEKKPTNNEHSNKQ
jgi:lysophospholipase L1-like esterase